MSRWWRWPVVTSGLMTSALAGWSPAEDRKKDMAVADRWRAVRVRVRVERAATAETRSAPRRGQPAVIDCMRVSNPLSAGEGAVSKRIRMWSAWHANPIIGPLRVCLSSSPSSSPSPRPPLPRPPSLSRPHVPDKDGRRRARQVSRPRPPSHQAPLPVPAHGCHTRHLPRAPVPRRRPSLLPRPRALDTRDACPQPYACSLSRSRCKGHAPSITI